MSTTLVTGATGFLGRRVIHRWVTAGRPVRALVRQASPDLPPEVALVRARGLTERDAIRSAVRGADTVVHLAARVHRFDDTPGDALESYRGVNVEGTRCLVEEARAAGVTRFILASSVKAMGEGNDQPWTEASVPDPVDPYGISKLEAEEVVARACGAGMSGAILRLPLVYGPGVGANFLRLLTAIDRGVPLPLGAIRNARSLVYSDNVVAAIAGLVERDLEGCEVFLVGDGAPVSTPELVRHIARALGRKPRLVPVPPWLFRAAGRAGDVLSHVLPAPLTSPQVDRLLGSLTVDSAKLRGFLVGWPPDSMERGLEATAQWFHGLESAARPNPGGGAPQDSSGPSRPLS
jgi:nucleoside-diphosphate-sugar epimerase